MLEHEQEDGTTPVYLLLDQAFEDAKDWQDIKDMKKMTYQLFSFLIMVSLFGKKLS